VDSRTASEPSPSCTPALMEDWLGPRPSCRPGRAVSRRLLRGPAAAGRDVVLVEVGVATAQVVGEAVAGGVEVEVATGLAGRRLEPCLRSTPSPTAKAWAWKPSSMGDRLVLAGREQLLRE
jgi:hypothetical protein